MDRVAIVGWCWFVILTALGYWTGTLLFSTPWTGGIVGFAFALVTMLAWPWMMPETVNAWMDDQPA